MSENDLLQGVLDIAALYGWRTLHLRPSRTVHGWRTAVAGAGVGFPDVLLVRGRRIAAAELKSERGHLTPAQVAWLEDLHAAGVETFTWRPADYPDRIAAILR